MESLYYNLPEDKGFAGFIRSIFSGPPAEYGLMEVRKAQDYLEAVRAAKLELECAEKLFNDASDPDLVEYAIYQERAAKLKLSYLIKKAKENKIKSAIYTTL